MKFNSRSNSRFLPKLATPFALPGVLKSTLLLALFAVASGCGKLNSDKRNSNQTPVPAIAPEGENKNPPAPPADPSAPVQQAPVPDAKPGDVLPPDAALPEPEKIIVSALKAADYKGAKQDIIERATQAAVFLKTTVPIKNALGVETGKGTAEFFLTASEAKKDFYEMRISIIDDATKKPIMKVANPQISKAELVKFFELPGSIDLFGQVGKQIQTDSVKPKVTVKMVALEDFAAQPAVSPSAQFSLTITSENSALSGVFATASDFSWTSPQRNLVDKVRVAEYNIENMWDDNDIVPSGYNDYSPKSSNWLSENVIPTKVRHVARAIAVAGSPDVVVLSEIESSNNDSRSLELLQPALETLGYRYFALGKQNPNNPVAVTNAIISKFPIVKNERLDLVFVPDQPNLAESLKSSARDPQMVEINVQGHPLRVYASHWKSRSGSASDFKVGDAMRMATAKLIKADIDSARAGNPALDVVVAGDLNAHYNESTVVEGLGSTGDETAMIAPDGTNALYNLWYEIPAADRGSYAYDGKLGTIDQILVNDALFDNAGLQLEQDSFHVVGRSGIARDILMNGDNGHFRWQVDLKKGGGTEFSTHLGIGYSDHLPHVFSLKLMPKTESGLREKMELLQPSTVAVSQDPQPDESTVPCSSEEYVANLKTYDFVWSGPTLLVGQCVTLTGANFTLTKVGFDAAFTLDGSAAGKRLLLSVVKSYGVNKDFLRKNLQKTPGKFTLKAVTGRLGYLNGKLAVFADSPEAIELVPVAAAPAPIPVPTPALSSAATR